MLNRRKKNISNHFFLSNKFYFFGRNKAILLINKCSTEDPQQPAHIFFFLMQSSLTP